MEAGYYIVVSYGVTKAILDRWRFRVSQLVRWRLRGLLNALPARSPYKVIDPENSQADRNPLRIVYLFAGTYGDFVQALATLSRLGGAFPKAEIFLWGADRYAREFGADLPGNLVLARGMDLLKWLSNPVDLVFTNCVGVYRVRFDFMARFLARSAFGFRHDHEVRRGSYTGTIPLVPTAKNFASENLRLLDLVGVSSSVDSHGNVRSHENPEPPWGKGKILFHIGSAGLKKDFGLKIYTRLVLGILNKLPKNSVEVIIGPGDEDIALEIRSGTGHVPQMFPIAGLLRHLRSFQGTILCFNSFSAHLCYYLDQPAIVIHREAIPYGYDCAPLHTQVILKSQNAWDVGEVLALVQAAQAKVVSAGIAD